MKSFKERKRYGCLVNLGLDPKSLLLCVTKVLSPADILVFFFLLTFTSQLHQIAGVNPNILEAIKLLACSGKTMKQQQRPFWKRLEEEIAAKLNTSQCVSVCVTPSVMVLLQFPFTHVCLG